jgi:hypothetical protein
MVQLEGLGNLKKNSFTSPEPEPVPFHLVAPQPSTSLHDPIEISKFFFTSDPEDLSEESNKVIEG